MKLNQVIPPTNLYRVAVNRKYHGGEIVEIQYFSHPGDVEHYCNWIKAGRGEVLSVGRYIYLFKEGIHEQNL